MKRTHFRCEVGFEIDGSRRWLEESMASLSGVRDLGRAAADLDRWFGKSIELEIRSRGSNVSRSVTAIVSREMHAGGVSYALDFDWSGDPEGRVAMERLIATEGIEFARSRRAFPRIKVEAGYDEYPIEAHGTMVENGVQRGGRALPDPWLGRIEDLSPNGLRVSLPPGPAEFIPGDEALIQIVPQADPTKPILFKTTVQRVEERQAPGGQLCRSLGLRIDKMGGIQRTQYFALIRRLLDWLQANHRIA